MLGLIALLQSLLLVVSGPAASPEYLPIRVAEAEGYFSREGLAVTVRSTRSEVGAAEALAQGQADLAATSLQAVLRFGPRLPRQEPLLVYGLTAAPPVALLVSGTLPPGVDGVRGLIGRRVGVAAPGTPEHAWLNGLLARAGVRLPQIELVSLGVRPLVGALQSGDVQAGLVPEPYASRLIADRAASLLVDLRTPGAVEKAFGRGTVNAAVFARSDRRPHDRVLAALGRALAAGERRLATARAAELAARLPRSVVGAPDDFERRLEASRHLYLGDGAVAPAEVEETMALIQAAGPLPTAVRVPRPAELLRIPPLTLPPPAR